MKINQFITIYTNSQPLQFKNQPFFLSQQTIIPRNKPQNNHNTTIKQPRNSFIYKG